VLFAGIGPDARFYFVHSYAATSLPLGSAPYMSAPVVSWATHGVPFVAAVENGPLMATQFHPEKSADIGAKLLSNWLGTLT
jgi:glutamine amidotransferase